MLSLEMSNGQFLTQEDLEKYLNSCSRFLIDKYKKEKLPEFEFEESREKIISEIHQSIIKYKEVQLVVEDVNKLESVSESYIWDNYIQGTVKFNGLEEIGDWDQFSREKLDLYVIKYKSNFNNLKNPYSYDDLVLPDYHFIEILGVKPEKIRRGQKRTMNLNFFREVYSTLDGYTKIYFDKKNLNPSPKVSSNSNCFVVTTVMGDVNHPIVEDFRRYRDNVIVKSYLGKEFISVYYLFGPRISKIIKNNLLIFKLSQWIVLRIHKNIINKNE